MKYGKIITFLGGVLMGTAGIAVLSSKDAKKAYTHATAAAESHVSHILSDRLSSRPRGWSYEGADRMSKLRCYEKNYGRDEIIELVRYSREIKKGLRTGTDDIPVKAFTLRELTTEHYDQAKSYIERIQATIPGLTARKQAAIRTQLRLL